MKTEIKKPTKKSRPVKKGGSFKKPTSETSNDFVATKEAFNSPDWYAANSALLRDSASLSYSTPVGIEIPSLDHWTAENIMVLNFVPTYGGNLFDQGAGNGFNLASRNIYTFVRHANSGSKNYEAPDLAIYLAAVEGVISFIAYLERIYGLIQYYSVKNRLLPKALIQGMHINFDDIVGNVAQFRYGINKLIVRAQSLCYPANMSVIKRRLWANSHVFKESDVSKSNIYVLNQTGWPIYIPNYVSSGGAIYLCRTTNLATSQITSVYLLDLGKRMLDAILEDEDMCVMSGDILKAFGSDNLVKFTFLPEDYIVMPEYEPEMLDQIHNTFAITNNIGTGDTRYVAAPIKGVTYSGTLPTGVAPKDLWLQQYNGMCRQELTVVSYPNLSATAKDTYSSLPVGDPEYYMLVYTQTDMTQAEQFFPTGTRGHLIDLKNAKDPEWGSPEETMVATRLHPTFNVSGNSRFNTALKVKIERCGTELVENISTVRCYQSNGSNNEYYFVTLHFDSNTWGGFNPSYLDRWTKFEYAPFIYEYTGYIVFGAGAPGNTPIEAIVGDTDLYTTCDNETLNRMHETAVLSEYTAPSLNIFTPK